MTSDTVAVRLRRLMDSWEIVWLSEKLKCYCHYDTLFVCLEIFRMILVRTEDGSDAHTFSQPYIFVWLPYVYSSNHGGEKRGTKEGLGSGESRQ